MSNISLKLSQENINKIKNIFKNDIKDNNNEYIDTFIQNDDITISIYKSDKVVFQGKDAFLYAQSFIEKKLNPQAGSDEVGTGDYFGPICVCACIIEVDEFELLNKLNVTDSKKITDEKILEIGPILISKIKHSLLILDNKKYNEVHETNNLNEIKAKLHNQAYLNLLKKGYQIPKAAYVDEFIYKDKYFSYLKNEKDVYHDLIFETKAEINYPAVACASVIARYAFIKKMNELDNLYKMHFHYGAGEDVNNDIKAFINQYGNEELKKVAKIHFKNTTMIK